MFLFIDKTVLFILLHKIIDSYIMFVEVYIYAFRKIPRSI